MPPRLETPRLILRPFVLGDAEAAYDVLDGHPEVWKYDPGFQRSREWRAAAVARYAANNEEKGVGTLAVTLRPTGELMGYVGLQHYLLPREPCATPEIELYYKLGYAYWGQGYAQEACRVMVQFAFETLRLARLVTITAAGNAASIKLLQRLGMLLEPAPSAWAGDLMATLVNPRCGGA